MKHIVYLNTDLVNSYISQIYNGIPQNTLSETTSENKQTDSSSHSETSKRDGKMGLDIFNTLKGNTGIESIIGPDTTAQEIQNSEIARELVETVIGDNALNLLIKDLENNNLLQLTNIITPETKYIKIIIPIKILNLEKMSKVLDNDFINTLAEIDIKRKIANEEIILDDNNSIEKEIENYVLEIYSGNTFLPAAIDFIRTLIPYDYFLLNEKIIIPVKNKYLREPIEEIAFNYDGDITILGKLTKKNFNKIASDEQNPLEALNFRSLIIEMLSLLYNTEIENIITPIALYFE